MDLKNDRISKLPDFILGGILSKLPFQNAISTTILSKRWRKVLPFPVNLVLDDRVPLNDQIWRNVNKSYFAATISECVPASSSCDFVSFVDNLLTRSFPDQTRVRLFNITCHNDHGDEVIVRWVRTALHLGAEELVLDFHLNDSVLLLRNLCGCATLRDLKLFGLCICVPDDFSLPNLETLHLTNVTVNDCKGRTINELVNGCPALENLELWQCNMNHMRILSIRSNRLKTLKLYKCLQGSKCNLVIDAPNLKRFRYEDGLSSGNYTLSKFKSLEYARIDVDSGMEQNNGGIQIISACSDSTSLYLSGAISEALQVPLLLPKFPNLTSLELNSLGIGGWALLARLLCNAPNLEKLSLEKVSLFGGSYADFKSLLPTVPICLERHTKNIEFRWLYRTGDEDMKLVAYLLENGRFLKKLEIHFPTIYRMSLQRLFDQPNHSKIHIRVRPDASCRPIRSFSHYLEI